MLRKFAMVTTLAAAVLSSISGNTVQAEVLVPLQQYLNTTNRNYEANQYKTSYTIYVPQLELNGTTITMNPKAVGEPVNLYKYLYLGPLTHGLTKMRRMRKN